MKTLASRAMLVTGLVALSAFVSPASAQTDLVADINQLKVAFAYNFSKYFTWPATGPLAQEAANNGFVLCTDGQSVANGEFSSLEGQLTQNRRITIRTTPAQVAEISAQCHMWYVEAQNFTASQPLLEALRNSPVLTVSDAAGSRNSGAVIELAVVNNRIQFRINNALMAEKQLSASAFLLRLAQ